MSLTENQCIGLEISIRREELGLSIEEFGKLVGKHWRLIRRYEAGEVSMKAITLRKIAAVLGCRMEDFFTPFDEQEESQQKNNR